MTEYKPIYVDEVDVSKCCYFNGTDKNYCEECSSEFGCAICNDRPNCYFKQLTRKVQECGELKVEKQQAEQKLKRIRAKVQAYIDDEADLTPEQVLQIIDEE